MILFNLSSTYLKSMSSGLEYVKIAPPTLNNDYGWFWIPDQPPALAVLHIPKMYDNLITRDRIIVKVL